MLVQIAPYRLDDSRMRALSRGFETVATACSLHNPKFLTAVRASHCGVPGIYAVTLRLDHARYMIYVGQTTSLTYRLGNYVSAFQPNAPNDFKLRIFESLIADHLPDAQLDLHFAPLRRSYATADARRKELRRREKLAIARFGPLLNRKAQPSPSAKQNLQAAFEAFYRSGVVHLLGLEDTPVRSPSGV